MKQVLWQNNRSSALNMLSVKCQLNIVVDRILKIFSFSRFPALIPGTMKVMRYLACECVNLHGKDIFQVKLRLLIS